MKQQSETPATEVPETATKTRVATRDLVTIGQRWAMKSLPLIVTIRQVHRREKLVEASVQIPFAVLRRKFQLIGKR